ncbi:MAG: nicotinate-nicotinamide nucleotide adenylyltransferase [Myxococcota bacterium]
MIPRRRIAVFGLSANPPTGDAGHRGIVRWLGQTPLPEAADRVVDEIWILPVYRHAFSQKRDLAAFEHRVAMCRLAFEDLPRARVLTTEAEVHHRTLPELPGTVDTLRFLREARPQDEFLLVLGQDTFADLEAGKWKGSDEILRLHRVVVIQRPGAEGQVGYRVPGLGPVSSTVARHDEDLAASLLHEPVAQYVRTHCLYPSAGC